jgi:transaldolase
MQRLLWSDTSPRNPQYGETFYVEQLIGPGTVSAMSPETLDAFILRGDLLYTLDNDLEAAQRIPSVLSSLEIDLFTVSVQLQEESIDSITSAHRAIYTALDKKRLKMVEEYA